MSSYDPVVQTTSFFEALEHAVRIIVDDEILDVIAVVEEDCEEGCEEPCIYTRETTSGEEQTYTYDELVDYDTIGKLGIQHLCDASWVTTTDDEDIFVAVNDAVFTEK